MKAIQIKRYGGPEVLKYTELPDLKPKADEILVELRAIGVNPVDTYWRSGSQGYGPALPFTPGLDGAGVVLKTGRKITKFNKGDRVYLAGSITGTYAEQCLVKENQIYPLPDNISFESGACINVPYATAYQALFHRGAAEPGEWLLVHGASGGVGIAALAWAHSRGLKIIGTAGTKAGLRMIVENGADFAVDHSKKNHYKEIIKIADGKGVDIIVEMLANINLDKDLEMLAPYGRVVVVGNRGEIDLNPRAMMSKDTAIVGMSLMNATAEEKERIHSAIASGLDTGFIKPVIQEIFSLKEAPNAHVDIIDGKSFGKIILVP